MLSYQLPDESYCLLRVLQVTELLLSDPTIVELMEWNGASAGHLGFRGLGLMKSTRFANEKYVLSCNSLKEYQRASKSTCIIGHSNNFVRSTTTCRVVAKGWNQLDQEIVSWFGISGRYRMLTERGCIFIRRQHWTALLRFQGIPAPIVERTGMPIGSKSCRQ